MTVSVDTSEARALAADFRQVDGRLTRHLIPAIKRGAVNIKESMQADLKESGNAGFRHVASAVNFDVTDGGFGFEVGPDKPAGALANIAYFGTSKGGGTVRDPKDALGDEEPNLLRELESLVERLVLG